jgi:hypothetical protein
LCFRLPTADSSMKTYQLNIWEDTKGRRYLWISCFILGHVVTVDYRTHSMGNYICWLFLRCCEYNGIFTTKFHGVFNHGSTSHPNDYLTLGLVTPFYIYKLVFCFWMQWKIELAWKPQDNAVQVFYLILDPKPKDCIIIR